MGTLANPTPIEIGEIITYDDTSLDNYYSFTINEKGNILAAATHYSNGFNFALYVYNDDLVSVNTKLPFEAGTYYINVQDSIGGQFSVLSTTVDDFGISPTPIKSGEIITFDTTQLDNYYTFIMDETANVIVSGETFSNGFTYSLKIYNENLERISTPFGRTFDIVLEKGTYYINASDNGGGQFSVTSNAIITPAQVEMRQQVMELYTAYFNRAADKAGLDYWCEEMDKAGWDINDVANTFAQQTEYTNLYAGLSDEEIVTQVYTNVLNRDADTAGHAYWSGELANGVISVTQLVQAVITAATEKKEDGSFKDENDATIFNNKLAVSQYAYDNNANLTDISLADITTDSSSIYSLKADIDLLL